MVENPFINGETKEIPGCLRIGVDFDNVMVATGLKVREIVKEKFGIDLVTIENGKTTTAYWLQDWPEIKGRPDVLFGVQQMFNDPQFHLDIKPFEGAVETVNQWRQDGHSVHIVTARSHPAVQQATYKTLVDLGLGWIVDENRLFFCKSGIDRIVAKPQIALDYRHHLFIEDHAETLCEITSPFLMNKIIVDFNYNYNRHLDLGTQTIRCTSWTQIRRVVSTCASWHYFLHRLTEN